MLFLNGMTVRRSVVGTRLDLQQSLEFARFGKVKAMVAKDKLENINDVFVRMHMREIEGRIVLDRHACAERMACVPSRVKAYSTRSKGRLVGFGYSLNS
jgi:hypothetical protein